jgi:predicted nucleotidyltransferase component of viral defense system
MINQYQCQTDDDYENALKEILQQVALLGLWRAKFFEHTAFYGGTALRVLYHLDRFSEDLDFSLLKPNDDFKLDSYLEAVMTEINAFGFDVSITEKKKTKDSAIKSAFLKENTREHLLLIKAPDSIANRCHGRSELKIKLEVDTDPPEQFDTEIIQLLNPIPHWVRTYTLPKLFAGKVSAVLCRQWQNRVKGRDYYDFLWFIQRATPLSLNHLEQRLRKSQFYEKKEKLTPEKIKELLKERIAHLDIERAKEDIVKFIKNPSRLEGWSQKAFLTAIDLIQFA